MGTKLQKKLARAIVKDMESKEWVTAGAMLEKVGYAKSVATRKPGETLNRKGVIEELKILGFSIEEADGVVAEILHDKKVKAVDRLNAADKVYKRLSGYAAEKHDIRQLNIEISKEIAEKNALNSGTIANS